MQYILAIILALTIYFLQAALYRKYWDRKLYVRISFSKTHANIGDTLELEEQIENRKLLPLPVLFVKFRSSRTFQYEETDNSSVSDYYYRNDIFSILGNQQITRKQVFRTTKRGYYVIDSIHLVANDLFMRRSYASILNNHAALYVYPGQLRDRQSLSLTSSIMGDITRKTLYEDPLSFRGIREYTSQDGMHYINWKATAKADTLMVNTYFDTQSSEIVLLLNLDTNVIQRSDDLQEYLIRVAATLLQHITLHGFAVRLAVNLVDSSTGLPTVTEPGTGDEHLHTLLQALAKLNLANALTDFLSFFDGTDSVFQNHTKNTVYLVISNYRKEALLQKYRDKKENGYQVLFICPEYTPVSSPVSDIQFWEVNADEI